MKTKHELKAFSVHIGASKLPRKEAKEKLILFMDICIDYGLPTRTWEGSGTNYGVLNDGTTECRSTPFGLHFKSLDEFQSYLEETHTAEYPTYWGERIEDRGLLSHGDKVVFDYRSEAKNIEGVVTMSPIEPGYTNPIVYICNSHKNLNGAHQVELHGHKHAWSIGRQNNSGSWDGIKNLRLVTGQSNKSINHLNTKSNEVLRSNQENSTGEINGCTILSKCTKQVTTGKRPVGNTATAKFRKAKIRNVAISKNIILA